MPRQKIVIGILVRVVEVWHRDQHEMIACTHPTEGRNERLKALDRRSASECYDQVDIERDAIAL